MGEFYNCDVKFGPVVVTGSQHENVSMRCDLAQNLPTPMFLLRSMITVQSFTVTESCCEQSIFIVNAIVKRIAITCAFYVPLSGLTLAILKIAEFPPRKQPHSPVIIPLGTFLYQNLLCSVEKIKFWV